MTDRQTNKHTDGHGNSMTDPAQRAESVKIHILMVGLTSYNSKSQVPNDIHMSNQFIPKENLKSQLYLNQIEEWTDKQKMKLNTDKTKCMNFNFTRKKQFSTRLTLKNTQLETVKEMKLLGTIIGDDLKWNKNTNFLVKKSRIRETLNLSTDADHRTDTFFWGGTDGQIKKKLKLKNNDM